MRRAVLILALALCTCALGVNAQAPALGAIMDKAAFLASLQAPKPVEASSRHLSTKSTCTVNLTCDVGGYPLSCSSTNGDCQSGTTWVKCDGNQQDCPVCYRSKVCCDGSTIECFGWTSCGPGGVRTVVCDGMVQDTCPPISQCGA